MNASYLELVHELRGYGDRRQRQAQRNAFTLIEVLTILFILALLIGLLLPAVQMAREAARRSRCTNNMRQFGTAFTSFESAHGQFPPGAQATVTGPLGPKSKWRMHSFFVSLLPHIEMNMLAERYNFDAMFCADENMPVISTPIPIAICPSSPIRVSREDDLFVPSLMISQSAREHPLAAPYMADLDSRYSTSFHGAPSDYTVAGGANRGIAERFGYEVDEDKLYGLDSMFPFPFTTTTDLLEKAASIVISEETIEFARGLRASDIVDGLSNTFSLIEVAGRPQHWQTDGRTRLDEPLEHAWADPRAILEIDTIGTSNCIVQCDNESGLFSFHDGVVNILFADGHVLSVDVTIETRIVLSWMTPDGEDAVELAN